MWLSLLVAQWPAPRDPVVSQDLLDTAQSEVSVGYTSSLIVRGDIVLPVANDLWLHQPLTLQARHMRGETELRGVLSATGNGPLLGVGVGRTLTENSQAPWVVDVGYSAALGRGWGLEERDIVGWLLINSAGSLDPYVNHIASARLRVIPRPKPNMQVPVSFRVWRSFSGTELREDSLGVEFGAGAVWQAPGCFRVGLGGAIDMGPLLQAVEPSIRANGSLACTWGG